MHAFSQELTQQFKEKIDKDGDGNIKNAEWTKFKKRWEKAKEKDGMRSMIGFLQKWLLGEDGGEDTVTLEVEVPFGVFPGMTMQVDHNGQQVEVVVPAGASPGMTLRIEVPAGPRPEPAQQQPALPSAGAPEPVDLTGDGMANAIGVRDSSGRFLHLRRSLASLVATVACLRSLAISPIGC